jgi:glycosyltransferase involved in cell wall biosynthesis
MIGKDMPSISIITPSYNQGPFIEQTILSVINQDYRNVEHIIIDGGSTDSTVEILKKYPHLIWISEKDRGQADALNKGLALATGDIIGWINSDDYYLENIFTSVAGSFADPAVQWGVGNLADLFDDGRELRFRKSPAVTFEALIMNPDIVRQQPTFFRREALHRVGGWNEKFYMVMDYDLWVRLARLAPPLMVDEEWAVYRNHSAQKSSHANILRQSGEIAAILSREKVSWPLIAAHRLTKRWYWLKGFGKEQLIRLGVVPEKYRTRPVRHAG